MIRNKSWFSYKQQQRQHLMLQTSDYRLKENVDYEFNALERVAQLKPASV